MRILAHAAASATALLCLLAAVSASSPAAAEGSQSATMLAAVTAPIAVAPALGRQDFSSADRAATSDTKSDTGAQGDAAPAKPATLDALVSDHLASETRDDEHECLATTVYFESKGQPLNGQLAVAETVLNRAESGRFPNSACGVVKQRGQFGFVRHGSLPSVPRASRAWKQAVAVAAIAREKLWRAVARNALYFNTGRAPSPRLVRVASFGPQVFYR